MCSLQDRVSLQFRDLYQWLMLNEGSRSLQYWLSSQRRGNEIDFFFFLFVHFFQTPRFASERQAAQEFGNLGACYLHFLYFSIFSLNMRTRDYFLE